MNNKKSGIHEGMGEQNKTGKSTAGSKNKNVNHAEETHPKWALENQTEGLDDQQVEAQWKKQFEGNKKSGK